MKTKIVTILATILLAGISPAKADIVWLSGHHEIVDGDIYGEIYIYNDVTLDILGGDIYKLETFDTTLTEWYAGEMDLLFVHDSSTANIFGGNLGALRATEDSFVNLYAYNVTYHPTGGHYDRGWIEGTYIDSDLYFNFDFVLVESFLHINVVPEPATILLLALGGFFLNART